MPDFWVYILRCADGSYYTGHTDDIDARMRQPRTGAFAGYTAARLPVEPVYAALFGSREAAFAAERRIKNWSRAKKEALIASDWDALKQAARAPAERRP